VLFSKLIQHFSRYVGLRSIIHLCVDGVQLTESFSSHHNVSCDFSFIRLLLGKLLGEGAFGMVVKAEATGIGGKPGTTTVAVKMLKGLYRWIPRFKVNELTA
jgi:hypothetical protein